MQTLSGSVGEGANNARHDAALVQAMLVLAQRPAQLDPGRSHYLATIDGDCGNKTKNALRAFQYDQVFVGPGGNTSQSVSGATAGIVAPGDTTWKTLVGAMSDPYKDLRALKGSKVVYLAASADQGSKAAASVAQLTFQPAFASQVSALIKSLHGRYGIAVGICREGDRRSFQTQYDLLSGGRNVTRAGPGESNHNFGQAVDLGFEGLRWLRENGKLVEDETSWLHRMDPGQAAAGEALFFWEVLRTEGTQQGLFRGPLADRPHLQAWSDAGVDMAARLAELLTRTGTMRWTGRNQRYQCDFGLGGRYFEVGSAAQIWNRQATVTAKLLDEARAQPTAAQRATIPAPPRAGVGAAPAATRPPAATAQDVTAMQAALRRNFEAADTAWTTWRPR